MPEADAWKLTERPMAELRKSGAFDYMAKLYDQKMNAVFLARYANDSPFHLYLTKPITKPDLSGLKIRITPVYRDFFSAWGRRSCKRRPARSIRPRARRRGWLRLAHPRHLRAWVAGEDQVSRRSWLLQCRGQRAAQQGRVEQAQRRAAQGGDRGGTMARAEGTDWAKHNAAEVERQKAAGIETIAFSAAEAQTYRAKAYAAGWEGIIKQSPEHGPKLKEFFSK
jgi:hypothetical protein